MKEWVKMPSKQFMDVESSPLTKIKWRPSGNADAIAALMTYIVLVHYANDGDSHSRGPLGSVKLTYDELCEMVGISRAKLAGGLKLLQQYELIGRQGEGRNLTYTISGYSSPSGWAKLPAKGLYDERKTHVKLFKSFKLRSKVELNALKIYLVLLSFRDRTTLLTFLSYDGISKYAGVQRNDIREALSYLVLNQFIHVFTDQADINEYSRNNQYRIRHLEANKKTTSQQIVTGDTKPVST